MVRSVTMPTQTIARSMRKRYAKKKSKTSPMLRLAVKEAIAKLAEKKTVLASATNVALTTSSGIPNFVALQPTISQGTSQNQRVGNQVRVVNASIRGYVNMLPYNATTNPLGPVTMVKIWIVRYKQSNPASLVSTDIATAFFDTGAGVSGLLGTPFDINAFPNKDSWDIVMEKTFKVGGASATGSIPAANSQLFDNSSSAVPFSFEFGSKLGMCLYNDTTTNPTNKNLFFVIQPIAAVGALGLYTPVEMHWNYKCDYIDV